MSKNREILPGNASALERALLESLRSLLDKIPNPYPDVKNPLDCPIDFLSLIASERGVLDWVSGDTEYDKRLTVEDAFDVHRLAGTRKGLQRAIETLDTSAVIKKSGPYALNIVALLKSKPLTPDTQARLLRRVNTYKSERDTISIELKRPVTVNKKKLVGVQIAKVIRIKAKK